jgi:Type I restriction-modification system methyltransferase subunit
LANNNGKDKSLESWIWDAACSIRGAKDAPKYKDYILPLIFTKRLCEAGRDGTKVINLIKSIEKLAEENSDDPYLIAMAERARAVQESFEQRQTSTAEALAELLCEVEGNETRKKEQAEKSFDGLTYFVYRSLLDAKIQNAEAVSRKIRDAFTGFPNWKRSENAFRELRKKVTFALFAESEDLDRVTAMVDELFTLLEKADRI